MLRFSLFSSRGWAIVACVFLFSAFCPVRAAVSAPAWVTAAAIRLPSFDYGKAHAAVLLDEAVLEVDSDGKFTTRSRWIVKILTKDGKENAFAKVSYNTSSSRIQSMHGWLIRASGEVVDYDKKQCIDVAVYEAGNLFTEARQRLIDAKDEADAGCVFAYEAVVEEKSIFNQERWTFSCGLPVEISTMTVSLPKNWRAQAKFFNHDDVTPTVNDRGMTWSLTQLAPLETEPLAPPGHSLYAWMAIDIHPPAGAKTPLVNFENWTSISRYFSPKYDAASLPTAAIKAKSDALVAGLTDPWERIKALCRFSQKVNYVSIFMNNAAAGGMIPRDATKVLQCNYGDCKDKANLLRALLRAQGIESFQLSLYSGDPTSVQTDWPSPTQFNHSILAIKVDDSVEVPGMLALPDFGRLVIFDPTNPDTPPGWLAEEDCGGPGLLLAGEKGTLIKLPSMRKQDNKTERTITAKVYADGSVGGTMVEKYIGLVSNDERHLLRASTPADYRKSIEHWFARSLPASHLSRVEPVDDFDKAIFTLTTEFVAPSHGKSMREVLLVFKPLLVARRNGTTFKKEKRTQPIIIDNSSYTERSVITLPDGYEIDELPKPTELKTSFGSYTARVTAQDASHLLVERSSDYSATWVPAAEYETVRAHFEKIQKAEQAPVVLRKAKPGTAAP